MYQNTMIREQKVNTFITQTYWWVVLGLIITAIASYLPVASMAVYTFLFGSSIPFTFIVITIAMIVLAAVMASKVSDLSFGTLLVLYIVFTVLTGLVVSVVHFAYAPMIITEAFAITIFVFLVMAIIGTVTKKDLTRMGSILSMILFAVIIVSIVNFFIGAAFVDYVICWVVVLLFIGLTAADAQKLKEYAQYGQNYSILGAVQLYLDFINLFLRILMIYAKAKK